MTPSPNQPDAPGPRAEPVQFTLAALMLLTLVVAVALALLVGVPSVVAVPIMLFLAAAVPAVLTAGVVYGRGYLRAFCIGALFPTGLLLYTTGWLFGLVLVQGGPPRLNELETLAQWVEFFEEIGPSYRAYAAAAWASSLLAGSLCVLARRVLLTRSPAARP